MKGARHPNARCSWIGFVVKAGTYHGARMCWRLAEQRHLGWKLDEVEAAGGNYWAGCVYQGA